MNPGIFLLRVSAAMVPTFLVWWLIGSDWLLPAVYLTEQLLITLMPKVFSVMNLTGDTVIALTHWQRIDQGFIPAAQIGTCLGTEFNIRILSYSFPFYISLQIALWRMTEATKIMSSLMTLYLILVISLTFVIAKRLIINLQLLPVFEQTTSNWIYNPDIISMGFQIATLLLPTLVPVMLWAASNHDYLKDIIKN